MKKKLIVATKLNLDILINKFKQRCKHEDIEEFRDVKNSFTRRTCLDCNVSETIDDNNLQGFIILCN